MFRDLSETDARALEQITTFIQLNHQERICTEGVYLIKEGRVKIADNASEPELETSKNTVPKKTAKNTEPDEKQQTKEVLEKGEMFGVVPNDGGGVSPTARRMNGETPLLSSYAETLSDVILGVVTIRDFSFFLKRKPHLGLPLLCLKRTKMPHVFYRVHSTFSYVNRNNENWYSGASNILKKNKTTDNLRFNRFSNIAFRCASSRFALLLHNLSETPDSKGVVLVPRLSKKRISRLIGSSTETTETLLNTFKQHDVIKRRRGRIQVLNPWYLKKIADASMKTLTAPTVPDTASDDDFGLELLTNLSNNNSIPTDSTVSQPQTVTKA